MPSVQDPSALAALTGTYDDDGVGLHFLQPKNQTLVPQVGAAPTQAQFNNLLTVLAAVGIITTA